MTVTGSVGVCSTSTDSDDIVITINTADAPTSDAGLDDSFCSINSYTLSGVAPNGTVLWSGGLGSFIPDATSPAATYTPSPAEITAGTVTLTMTVTGTANACSGSIVSDDVILTISPSVIPSVSISSDDVDNLICSGNNIVFTATPTNGGPSPSYQWKVNGLNVGTGGTTYSNSSLVDGDIVTVEMTPNNLCQTSNLLVSNSIDITVNSPIVVTSSSESTQEVCLGGSFNPLSISVNGGGISYQWYSNLNSSNVSATQISGATNSSYIPDASNVGTTYYYCVVSNECSSDVQGPISEAIIVNESIILDGTLSQNQTICLGEVLLPLSTVVSSGSVTSFQWYTNTIDDNTSGAAITGETASTYLPDETIEGETFYYYEAIGNCGTPVVSGTISINVNSLPSTPSLNTNYVICNDPLPAYVNLDYSQVLNWYSDIAKTISIGTDSIPTTSETTTYYVSQTINGCEGAITPVDIEISDCLIDVPTAFTPDGDNVNDTWQLVDLDNYFPKNIVTIYSRWGELLYTSPEGDYESFPWDGKLNDEVLPVGSYYYFIDYNDESGKKVNGVVTIILNK